MKATIDNGKYNFKMKADDKRIIIPSKISIGYPVYGEDFISFENVPYIIGEEAKDYDFSITKNNLHHKLMLYFGLSKIMNEVQSFDLTIGCPLTTYLNRNKHETYIDSIRNNGQPIEIQFNNKKKIIIIRSVTIVPETLGGYILDYKNSKNEIRGVIDIGGLNLNAGIYSLGKPLKDRMITDNLGIHILLDKIQKAIMVEREELLDLNICEYLLKSKNFKDDITKKIFERECINHLEDIKRLLIKSGWNLEDLTLRFIGGGSILLKEYIEQVFKKYNTSIEEDIFANCEAFEEFANKKNGTN